MLVTRKWSSAGTHHIGRLSLLALGCLAAAMSPVIAGAETGVTDQSIRIGMSNALTGPAAGLGTEMKRGVEVYFRKVNAAGGVHGRKLELISFDDKYEPEEAAKMTKKLIEEENVFALTGFVGTPTGKAAVPVLSAANVPLVGMFTGAEAFRNPVNKNVYHIRASYFAETETLVDHLVKDLDVMDIGIFIQDDAYGAAGEAGVLRALAKRNLTLAAKAVYKRNSTDVQKGFEELMRNKPRAVIMVGAYSGCAALMKMAHDRGYRPVFLNISFVGTKNLVEAAGEAAEGSYISQVVPLKRDFGATKSYLVDMKAVKESAAEEAFGMFEGYLTARVLVEGIKRAGKNLTRDGLRQALDALKDFDLGGIKVSYTPNDHEGMKQIYLTKVVNGKPVPINKMEQ